MRKNSNPFLLYKSGKRAVPSDDETLERLPEEAGVDLVAFKTFLPSSILSLRSFSGRESRCFIIMSAIFWATVLAES